MADPRDAKKKRQRHETSFEKETIRTKGTVVARAGTTAVPGLEDHVWVQPMGTGEPVAVYNRAVKGNRDGLGVIIGYSPGSSQLEILQTDIESMAGFTPTAGLSIINHALSHLTDGDDPLYVYARAIVMLLAYPASGLAVRVSPYSYIRNGEQVRFTGSLAFDLSAHEPATGLARWVLVGLDTATNTLTSVAGDTALDTLSITPPFPAIPAGVMPSAFVRIAAGQTEFTETDFVDARDFLTLLVSSSETVQGIIETATQAEADLGEDTSRAITPATLKNRLAVRIKNTSGAAAAIGDVGYINEAGEYKTTTTAAASNILWCVVVAGGANNADIYVAQSGRWPVNYTGTAPSAGHYLITSTSAGDAQRQTYVSPEIFAVCLAAGSGGVVEALLLCNRVSLAVPSTEDVVRISNHSGTDFTGTIAAKSGANVEYTTTGGTFEDSIKPASSGELGKIVLHNTTRGTSALIDSVNLTNTGTPASGTITLTATAPAAWQVGDAITTRSQTNTSTITGGSYFIDVDLSSADNTLIPPLAVVIKASLLYQDSTATVSSARSCLRHPFEADAASKRDGLTLLAGNSLSHRRSIDIPLIQRKFCINCAALGSGTATFIIRLSEVVVAAP